MRKLLDHFGRTALTGVLVLLPIVLMIFVLLELFGLLEAIVEPIAEQLPVETIVGIDVRYVVSFVSIVLVCYMLGSLVETKLGGRINAWIERRILDRVPGYSLARSLTRGVAGRNEEAKFSAGLARLHGGGAQMMGLIVERHTNGTVTFFVPQAPTPTLGHVYIVPAAQVEELAVPATSMLNCIMQWGIGSQALMAGSDVTPA